TGTLHGENWLQVHGYDILNAGTTTGTGYIEIKGRDITNNTWLSSNTIVVEGTGNVINNNIIETGVFRAKYKKTQNKTFEPTWITWVNPNTETPNFHISSSFGRFILQE
ncbi:MAG TPA: hypothetical protein PLH20_11990, partial [Flavobacterium sp.]|nr:hypothetical protein [Flavobacterium sp.]